MDMLSPDTKSCIETCLKCYATWLGMASNHHLKAKQDYVGCPTQSCFDSSGD